MCIIKSLRIQHGLTCEEMAEIINCKSANYTKKERGQLRFSLEQARIFSEYFHLTIEEIFYAEEDGHAEETDGADSTGDDCDNCND